MGQARFGGGSWRFDERGPMRDSRIRENGDILKEDIVIA